MRRSEPTLPGVVRRIRRLGDHYLRSPTTVETTVWEDGDYAIRCYHTIATTAPEDRDTILREEIHLHTGGEGPSDIRLRVVRRYPVEGGYVERHVHTERLGTWSDRSIYKPPLDVFGRNQTLL